MNRRAFLAALAAAIPAAAGAQGADDPRAIVEQIYKISAGKDGAYSGESAFFQAAARKRWFSKSLIAALAAMDRKSKRLNEPILDFDPVTNSQDPGVHNLAVAIERQDDKSAVATARFSYEADGKEPLLVRYIFIREAGAWKLNDMSGERGKGEDKWILRDLIK